MSVDILILWVYKIFVAFKVASQGVPVVNIPPAKTGDVRDAIWSLDWENPLEKDTATQSSILAWKNPIGRGTWWASMR